MSAAQLSQFPPGQKDGLSALPAIPDVQKQTILDYLKAFGLASELTEAEKLQFIEIAQAFKLNPFKREIHVAVFGEGESRRMSIVVGYETYLKRAERTGKLDGWNVSIDGEGENMVATVEIWRRDWSHSFRHQVYWREAVQKKRDGTSTSFWAKQPRLMLRKVALAQGFRWAFPEDLSGLPYDAAELPDAESAMPATTFEAPASKQIPYANESALSSAKSSAQPECSLPESKINSMMEPEPEPEDEITKINRLHDELRAILEDNEDAFTPKHQDWILAKARQANTTDGVERMVAYARKVLKNAASMAATA